MRRRSPRPQVIAFARLLAEVAVDEYVREIKKPPRKPKKRS